MCRTLVVWTKRRDAFILTRVKPQFDLNLALSFRRSGEDVWLSGYTERIGATSILFHSMERIEPAMEIEMVFQMPVVDPCRVECVGRVIEVEMPNVFGQAATISASIERYSFVRL
jgi:hypothetical protein